MGKKMWKCLDCLNFYDIQDWLLWTSDCISNLVPFGPIRNSPFSEEKIASEILYLQKSARRTCASYGYPLHCDPLVFKWNGNETIFNLLNNLAFV